MVIVLLFAEARRELGILPVDDTDYQAGYSVSRLRDLALVELHGVPSNSAWMAWPSAASLLSVPVPWRLM